MRAIDERAELARAVAELASSEMPLGRLREVAQATSFDRRFWDVLREAGVLSVLLPESLGGLGLRIEDVTRVFYELGRNPLPGPVLDNAVAAPIIRAAATAEDTFDETMIVAVADPSAMTWPRPPLSVGSGRISGRVELVRAAAVAEAFLIVVADEDAASIFLVPKEARGVVVEADHPLELSARYGAVVFDVALSDATELLSGPSGRAVVDEMQTALRLAMAAEVAGAGRVLLDLSAAYALVREQFGRTIGSFQAVQQILAETFEYSSALDSLLDWCVAELPAASAAEAYAIGLKAKAAASEFGRRIAEDALQVHGGIGFTAEHDLSVYYKLILAREAHYGDRRSLCGLVGRSLLTFDV